MVVLLIVVITDRKLLSVHTLPLKHLEAVQSLLHLDPLECE